MIEENVIVEGDALVELKSIQEKSIDLVITDPPYFIENLKKDLKKQSIRQSSKNSIFHNEFDHFENLEAFQNFMKKILLDLQRVMKDKAQCYMFCSYHHLDWLIKMIKDLDFRYYKPLFWYKPDVMGVFPNQYGCSYEVILWFRKKGKEGKYKNHIGNGQRDVFVHYSTNQKYRQECGFHPTPKPIELIRRLIKNGSDEGDLILDPFLGSGTTAVASQQTNRRYIGIELNEEYLKIAERRLKQKNLNVWGEIK